MIEIVEKAIRFWKGDKTSLETVFISFQCKIFPTLLVVGVVGYFWETFWTTKIDCWIYDGIPNSINTHCLLEGTYVKPFHTGKDIEAKSYHKEFETIDWQIPVVIFNGDALLPGIYPNVVKKKEGKGGDDWHSRNYMTWYPWIPTALIIWAAIYHLPMRVLRSLDGGRVKSVVGPLVFMQDLNQSGVRSRCRPASTAGRYDGDRQRKMDRRNVVLTNWKQKSHMNRCYSISYVLIELSNIAILAMSIFHAKETFGNRILTYLPDTVDFFAVHRFGMNTFFANETTWYLPGEALFPPAGLCTAVNFGAAGGQRLMDTWCWLPLNTFNRYLFMMISLCLWCLMFGNALAVLQRLALILLLCFRAYKLAGLGCDYGTARKAIRSLSYCKFFFLYQICKNLDPTVISDVLRRIPTLDGSKSIDKIIV